MSRADRFDRSDFDIEDEQDKSPPAPPEREATGAQRDLTILADVSPRWMWPINPTQIKSLGDSIMANRPKKNQPHHGLDIYAPPGARIYAASSGLVLRVKDGRHSSKKKTKAAGLYVDVLTDPDPSGTQYIQRYLHLATVRDIDKQRLALGAPIGELAAPHTSGLAGHSHLHFEVRAVKKEGGYGPPLDPRRFLPPLSVS